MRLFIEKILAPTLTTGYKNTITNNVNVGFNHVAKATYHNAFTKQGKISQQILTNAESFKKLVNANLKQRYGYLIIDPTKFAIPEKNQYADPGHVYFFYPFLNQLRAYSFVQDKSIEVPDRLKNRYVEAYIDDETHTFNGTLRHGLLQSGKEAMDKFSKISNEKELVLYIIDATEQERRTYHEALETMKRNCNMYHSIARHTYIEEGEFKPNQIHHCSSGLSSSLGLSESEVNDTDRYGLQNFVEEVITMLKLKNNNRFVITTNNRMEIIKQDVITGHEVNNGCYFSEPNRFIEQ